MKCIIYARTATEVQDSQSNSLDVQEQTLREYATKNNLEVGKIIKEIGSGNDINRAGYKKLLECISSGKYNSVLCKDTDRVSRNLDSYLKFRELIKRNKMKFITLNGVTNQSPEDKFQELMTFAFNQLERDLRSEKIKRGIEQAKLRKQ